MLDYSSADTPDWYYCRGCNAKGVKLWYEHGVYNGIIETLVCFPCLVELKSLDPAMFDELAQYPDLEVQIQFGWHLPAIADLEHRAIGSLTSSPEESRAWWKRLPARPL